MRRFTGDLGHGTANMCEGISGLGVTGISSRRIGRIRDMVNNIHLVPMGKREVRRVEAQTQANKSDAFFLKVYETTRARWTTTKIDSGRRHTSVGADIFEHPRARWYQSCSGQMVPPPHNHKRTI